MTPLNVHRALATLTIDGLLLPASVRSDRYGRSCVFFAVPAGRTSGWAYIDNHDVAERAITWHLDGTQSFSGGVSSWTDGFRQLQTHWSEAFP